MAFLKFLKGDYAKLNTTAVAEGQILICNDTAEMFVDVAADKRIKIGDFTVVATLAALEALDATAVPTSRLYYVEDGNILARSNGTTWVQVNKQKTAEELKTMLGLGSMAYVSEVTEDNLAAELKEKVNAASEGNHAHSNKDVLDGITAEKVAAWDAAEQNAKDYADGKDEAIAAAKKAGDDAAAAVIAHATEAATTYETKTDATAKLTEAKGYTDTEVAKVQGEVDAFEALVGTVTEGKTVVEMIADAQTAATYDDTQIKADIQANADAIAAEKTRAEGIEDGLRTDVDAIKADYLKAADKEALQTQINTIINNPDTEGVINSINEFTKYIEDHGEIAEGFRTDIDANKAAIEAEVTRATAAEEANAKAIADQAIEDAKTYETKTDATAKLTEAKEYADGLNTAIDTRVNALEAIDHDAYKAADTAILTEAKAYTDELANGAVADNTANVADMMNMLTWGEFN